MLMCAIETIVKAYLKLREIPPLQRTDATDKLMLRMWHFKQVLDNGYVTLFDLMKYPSAFMLMVKLGADLSVQKTNSKLGCISTTLILYYRYIAKREYTLLYIDIGGQERYSRSFIAVHLFRRSVAAGCTLRT